MAGQERGRGPTHRVIAKPDDRGRRGPASRYEVIGVGWESERGGISLRFHAFADLRRIVDDGAHVLVVREDDRTAGGGEGWGGDPGPGDADGPGY